MPGPQSSTPLGLIEMPRPEGPIGPTTTIRPSSPPAYNLSSAGVSSQIGVITSWLIGLGMGYLAVAPPPEVQGALTMLVAAGIAGAVSYVATLMRNAQWHETGEVTGVKTLL